MITKKISTKMALKLLRIVRKNYIESHGEGIRNLSTYPVLITAHELYTQYMPEIAEVQGDVMRPRLLDLLKELESMGLMRVEGGVRYFMTVKGYEEASKSKGQQFVEYWNRNPGLSTIISIVSMIIAGGSLWVSLVALNKPSPQPQVLDAPGATTSNQFQGIPSQSARSSPTSSPAITPAAVSKSVPALVPVPAAPAPAPAPSPAPALQPK